MLDQIPQKQHLKWGFKCMWLIDSVLSGNEENRVGKDKGSSKSVLTGKV